jgi:hypothetical protein
MHAIDLHYLYLSGNLTLRPRRVVTAGAADALFKRPYILIKKPFLSILYM